MKSAMASWACRNQICGMYNMLFFHAFIHIFHVPRQEMRENSNKVTRDQLGFEGSTDNQNFTFTFLIKHSNIGLRFM